MAKNHVQKFDLFVPFGSVCITSKNLRENKLQIYSMPYDWIGPVSLSLAVDFLEKGFDGLMSKNMLEYYGQKEGHMHFKMPNGVTFQHDFRLKDLSEYDKVAAKYKRRIKRLYQSLKKATSVLFVHFDENYPGDGEIEKSFERLAKRYSGKKIKILYVVLSPKEKNWQVLEDNSHYELAVVSHTSKEDWVGRMDLIREILSGYGLTWKIRLKNMLASLRHRIG